MSGTAVGGGGEAFFETAPILLLLIWIGRYVEGFAKKKSRDSLSNLLLNKSEECWLQVPNDITDQGT